MNKTGSFALFLTLILTTAAADAAADDMTAVPDDRASIISDASRRYDIDERLLVRIEYINHTIAASEALGLDFPEFSREDENSQKHHDIYNAFRRTVDGYTVRIISQNIRVHPQPLFRSMKTTRSTPRLRH